VITVRAMRRSDIPAVAALERIVYPKPWSARVFFDELAQGNRTYLLLEDAGGALVGYGGFLLVEEDAHITTLAVAPEARRRHLGTRLLLALVERAVARGARHLTLEVRASNVNAQQLYERFGFQRVGRRKGYYEDEDAFVMWALDVDTEPYAARLAAIRAGLEAEDGA